MRFNLMGPFEIVGDDGRVHLPTTPKVCQTLALLLTRPNEIVAADSVIQELWGDDPPRSAHATVQTYIHQARRMFRDRRLTDDERRPLATHAPGYLIRVADEEVDSTVFQRLVDRSRTVRAGGTGRRHAGPRLLSGPRHPDHPRSLLCRATVCWKGTAAAPPLRVCRTTASTSPAPRYACLTCSAPYGSGST